MSLQSYSRSLFWVSNRTLSKLSQGGVRGIPDSTVVEMVDRFESAPEAVEALVVLEMRLARERRRVRPSLRAGPKLRSAGH